jgi:enterochelin esterase-like enzyme
MKSLALSVLAAVVAIAAPAPSPVSPEVHPDGRVTFRLNAPDATAVALRFESDAPVPMKKGAQGVWSATTGALPPDIYSYGYVADGIPLLDPSNPRMKYNLVSSQSEVQVPGPAALPWEINDVPRGTIHHHFYKSAIVGDQRDFFVYTPPGYDPAAKPAYPVLYLLHGFSDDATAWSTVRRANVILDNLIARGQAKPMLIVMPLGYGNWDVLIGGYSGPGKPGSSEDSNAKFGDSLLTEVIPQVERLYHVSSDGNARAIAGLSMGGAQSLLIGLNHPDRFAWIGAFSSGGLNPDLAAAFPSLGKSANAKLRLLWIACGRDDGLIRWNQKIDQWLTAQSVGHVWHPTPGIHSFTVWRRYLAEFAPLLFQDRP